jgi:hypothetical protein
VALHKTQMYFVGAPRRTERRPAKDHGGLVFGDVAQAFFARADEVEPGQPSRRVRRWWVALAPLLLLVVWAAVHRRALPAAPPAAVPARSAPIITPTPAPPEQRAPAPARSGRGHGRRGGRPSSHQRFAPARSGER